MKRLIQFFVGSTTLFFMLLSVFNLALFLELAGSVEEAGELRGAAPFLDDLFPKLWSAFGYIALAACAHFVVTAIVAVVYWFCWRAP